MGLVFEWDRRKAFSNLAKHGVSFDEATTAFGDPLSLIAPAPDHSEGESRRGANEGPMKRAKNDGIRDEYDFSKGVRGKYAERFAAGSNVVVLDADLAKRFRDSRAVNQALRSLVELADRSAKQSP